MITILRCVLCYTLAFICNVAILGCFDEFLDEVTKGNFKLLDTMKREMNIAKQSIIADPNNVKDISRLRVYTALANVFLFPLFEMIIVKGLLG